jgi:putative chitinase
MRPEHAAAIMFDGMVEGWFTGKKLADYFGAKSNWTNARRIINGTDKAATIADYALEFFAALKAAETVEPYIPPPPDIPAPEPVVPAQPSSEGFFMRAIRALFAWLK